MAEGADECRLTEVGFLAAGQILALGIVGRA